jgi:hypothetical protein
VSLDQKRAEIAAALSTVADVTGWTQRPGVPNVGDAWPLLGPMDRADGDAFIVTWLVRVFVPQDEIAASSWWDQHWPPLYFALQPVGFVDRVAPVALAQDQLAFEITMRAEE